MKHLWYIVWFTKSTISLLFLWAVVLFVRGLLRRIHWGFVKRRADREPVVHSLGTLPAPRNVMFRNPKLPVTAREEKEGEHRRWKRHER